ncbi:acyl-CoA synthetase [Luteithermobacter gelatinilyticus]|uniref:acyl-CoA synthetase n=1 Tax=Luteithermobacter gelatinilyticus TaxID=2582913 RepID=UPI001106DBED|nr:acyl-CoA synthetase [Luteithermobacter gelatinilyticus]
MKVAQLSDIEAIESVPLEERYDGEFTSYAVIARAARQMPDKPALQFLATAQPEEPPRTLTYGQLFTRVTQTANLFHDLGLGPGDVVSYLLPNLPETHFVLWGGEAAGIVNPINPLLDVEHIAGIMCAAKSRLLVALGPVPGTDLWDKALAVRDLVPSLEKIIRVGGAADSNDPDIIPPDVIPYEDVIDRYNAAMLDSGRRIRPDDICSLFHTGGTTGVPKLAQHTHRNEVADALMIAVAGQIGEEAVGLCGLPLFHVNAAMVTGLTCFLHGATVVLATPMGYRTPALIANFWKIVEKYRVTFFSAVPTVYASLLSVPLEGEDLSSLDFAICGAAPMPRETIRRFEALTGLALLEGYGLTEGTCASSFNPRDGERRVGSIGLRLPYQQMKTVILDEAGRYVRDCVPDEIGAVVIKGPNVFPGYVQEEANKDIWVADGWLNTGDMGRQDSDGYFWLTGRAKELIIRGGHNIDPALIENALARHPAVREAAAVGQPDSYAGELPVAYVSLTPGAMVTEEDLLAFAKEHIAERAAIPKAIYILDHLPLTAVGKIFKPALRYDAIRREFAAALADIPDLADIHVDADPQQGTLATIRLKPGASAAARAKVEKRLGAYPVPFVLD